MPLIFNLFITISARIRSRTDALSMLLNQAFSLRGRPFPGHIVASATVITVYQKNADTRAEATAQHDYPVYFR